MKLAEAGGAEGPGRAARLSQLEDQLSTGAQREGVLQSQLTDALQQCADQVCSAASPGDLKSTALHLRTCAEWAFSAGVSTGLQIYLLQTFRDCVAGDLT